VGVVYGTVAGGVFGSLIIPFFGTIYGLFWGAIAGFVAGTVGGTLGPRWFGVGGLIGGLATIYWFRTFYIGGTAFWRVALLLGPGVIGSIIGVTLSRQLSGGSRRVNIPLAGWLREMFERFCFSTVPLWQRCLAGGTVLGAALTIEWARIHFDVILW